MQQMRLNYCERLLSYTLTDAEADRLCGLIDSGESLHYEDEMGCVQLCDGILTLSGFSYICKVFSSYTPLGVMNQDSEAVLRLKSRIRGVIVDEGTREIGSDAFKSFVNLSQISIPDSVNAIYSPFENCSLLSPYRLPKNLKKTVGKIFGIYPSEVVLPEGMESFYDSFKESDIESIVIPGSIKEISFKAFSGCKKLRNVALNEGLCRICSGAFEGCTSLETMTIPSSVTVIHSRAFEKCTALFHVEFPSGASVAKDAFIDTPYHDAIMIDRSRHLETILLDMDPETIEGYSKIAEQFKDMAVFEQAKHLILHYEIYSGEFSYGKAESESYDSFDRAADVDIGVNKFIVKDGALVGVMLGDTPVLIGKTVLLYSYSDEDGPGARIGHKSVRLYYKE